MLHFPDIRLLYLREIRSALRERNILFNVVLMPLFLYPVMLWLIYTGITFVVGQTENFTSRVAIRVDTGAARDLEVAIRQTPKVDLVPSRDPAADIRSGDLDILVNIRPAGPALAGNVRVGLTYDGSKDRSRMARDRVAGAIDGYRARFLEARAEELGLSRTAYQQFWIEQKDVATGQEMGRFILGLLVPITLIVMIGIGGTYPALDATAGERERSTWETLMTTGTTRINIVVAKYLYVTTMASVAGMLNMGAMMFSVRSLLGALIGSRVDALTFTIPWTSAPLIVLFTVLLALFIAAGMMILAAFARTFKEAQSMASPFLMVLILPVAFLQEPGIEFSMTLAAVPVMNVCMVFREAISGVFHWPQIGLAIGVELLSVAAILWLASAILRYEDVLIGSYEGNFFRFLRERAFRQRMKDEG
jgi:sodium transport system permease protein